MSKFYAVRGGHSPGIYRTWDECKKHTHGVPGAICKSFFTEEDALCFVKNEAQKLSVKSGYTKLCTRDRITDINNSDITMYLYTEYFKFPKEYIQIIDPNVYMEENYFEKVKHKIVEAQNKKDEQVKNSNIYDFFLCNKDEILRETEKAIASNALGFNAWFPRNNIQIRDEKVYASDWIIEKKMQDMENEVPEPVFNAPQKQAEEKKPEHIKICSLDDIITSTDKAIFAEALGFKTWWPIQQLIRDEEYVYATPWIIERKKEEIEKEKLEYEEKRKIREANAAKQREYQKEQERLANIIHETIVRIVVTNGVVVIQVVVESGKRYDIYKREALKKILKDYRSGRVYRITKKDDIFDFIRFKLPEIYKHADQVLISKEFSKLQIIDDFDLSAKGVMNKNHLELELLTTNFSDVELSDILNALHKKQKYYQFASGRFIALDNEAIKNMQQLISGLNVGFDKIKDNKLFVEKHRSLYLDQKMEQLNLELEKCDVYSKMVADINMLDNNEFEVPKVINANLREYQKEGFNWLKHLQHYNFGGILADDMGLGKTLQVITLLSANEAKAPSLVVCPSSLSMNWAAELDKFAPQINYLLLNQQKQEREDKLKSFADYDLIIITYDILKRDILLLENAIFEYVILDEGQYIKNHTTQTAKAAKLLKANKRLVITGTPIENSIAEMWSIFDFLMPGYLLNYKAFSDKYEKPINRYGNAEMLNELRELVAPFILRRLKQDVLTELPDKTITTIYAEMDVEQRKLYEATVYELKNLINEKNADLGQSKIKVLSLLTRLRQLCCNPSLVDETYSEGSAKYEVVLELVEELKASNHKIILFSQFTSNFNHLKDLFDEKQITYFELTGQTNTNKRQKMVEEFNNNDTDIFLISLKAGGTGLNITGADTVIHLDPWWNMAAENQATDRVHRMGQKNHVNVYKIIAKDTIEEKILNMQQSKLALANSVLEDNNVSLKTMSKDDLLDILIKPTK